MGDEEAAHTRVSSELRQDVTVYPLPYTDSDLSGQVALVTGATSGLGQRFARTLAATGASVAIAGRRRERLGSLAADLTSAGHRCVPVALDVTDADELVGAVNAAEGSLGTVSILVNNAGIPDAQRAVEGGFALLAGCSGSSRFTGVRR